MGAVSQRKTPEEVTNLRMVDRKPRKLGEETITGFCKDPGVAG